MMPVPPRKAIGIACEVAAALCLLVLARVSRPWGDVHIA